MHFFPTRSSKMTNVLINKFELDSDSYRDYCSFSWETRSILKLLKKNFIHLDYHMQTPRPAEIQIFSLITIFWYIF